MGTPLALRHPWGCDTTDGAQANACDRGSYRGTCLSLSPDPTKGRCHLVPLTSVPNESVPAAPGKKCRQSLPGNKQPPTWAKASMAVQARAAHLCTRRSSATGLATLQPNSHPGPALPGTEWSAQLLRVAPGVCETRAVRMSSAVAITSQGALVTAPGSATLRRSRRHRGQGTACSPWHAISCTPAHSGSCSPFLPRPGNITSWCKDRAETPPDRGRSPGQPCLWRLPPARNNSVQAEHLRGCCVSCHSSHSPGDVYKKQKNPDLEV